MMYLGVVKTPAGTYRARVNVKGHKMHIGHFKTAEEAAKERDAFIIRNGLSNRLSGK